MNRFVAVILFSLPGLVLAVVSFVFFWLLFPDIIHSEIVKQVRLVEGSDTWNKWKEAPIPIYLSFYIQSVTNPDEVENGEKPVFEEKGPYAYLQKRKKIDISQEDGENTVKYKEVKTFFFDQEHSGNNSEQDLVTIPNIPFVGVIHTIRKTVPLDLVAGLIGNVILSGEPLIRRNVTVEEVLFKGFDVSRFTQSILASQLPPEFKGGRFGLYKGKNGTASEVWEIYTGVDNSNNFGRIKTWNGKANLGFWKPQSTCDKPFGSDGSVFTPFLTKKSVLQTFSPDICRSLPLIYQEEVEHLGIPGYRFSPSKDSFDSPRENSANRCFCLEDKVEDCSYSGVLSLESCTKAPIFASSPHFFGADARYFEESGQDQADEAVHKTYIDLEPNTGLLLRAHKRLQFNLEIRYNRKVRVLQNLTKEKVIFPLVWAEESAEIDDNLANQLKGQLFTPLQIVGIAKWVVLAASLALFGAGAGYSINKHFLRNPDGQMKKGVDLTRPSTASNGSGGSSRKRSAQVGAQRENRDNSISSAGTISFID